MLSVPTDLVVQRLKSQCATLLDVKLALSFSLPAAYPSAYIFLISEHAEKNELFGGHYQQITGVIGVELMVQHFEDNNTGGPSALALEELRIQVMAELMGWAPSSDFSPFNFISGDLISYQNGYAVWRDQYSTFFYR